MGIRELSARLLVAHYIEAQRNGFDEYLEPKSVAQSFSVKYGKGILRAIVKEWEMNGLAAVEYTLGGGSDGGMHIQLTATGIEAAESLLEANPDYAEPVLDSYLEPKNMNDGDAQIIGDGVLGDPVFASLGATQTTAAQTTTSQSGLSDAPMIPASDRYVSVRHNQEPFDEAEKSLDDVLREFARDHGKNNLIQSEQAEFLKSEIVAFKAQKQAGYVSEGQLKDRLLPALLFARDFFAALPGLVLAIGIAIQAVNFVLTLF